MLTASLSIISWSSKSALPAGVKRRPSSALSPAGTVWLAAPSVGGSHENTPGTLSVTADTTPLTISGSSPMFSITTVRVTL